MWMSMADLLSCQGIDLDDWLQEEENKRTKTLLEIAQQKANQAEKSQAEKAEEEEVMSDQGNSFTTYTK